MSAEICPFCGKTFKRLKKHIPHCKASKEDVLEEHLAASSRKKLSDRITEEHLAASSRKKLSDRITEEHLAASSRKKLSDRITEEHLAASSRKKLSDRIRAASFLLGGLGVQTKPKQDPKTKKSPPSSQRTQKTPGGEQPSQKNLLTSGKQRSSSLQSRLRPDQAPVDLVGSDRAQADPVGSDRAQADPVGSDRAQADPVGSDRARADLRAASHQTGEWWEAPPQCFFAGRSLGQVRLRELPVWIAYKTPTHPGDVGEMIQKGWRWYYRKYIDVRRGGVGGPAMMLAGFCVLSYIWTYPHIKLSRWRKYH